MQRLVVIAGTVHRAWDGHIYAYEPYVREANLWFTHVERVCVCAPVVTEQPAASFVPYDRPDIEFVPLPAMGGHTIWAKLAELARAPRVIRALWRAMRASDQIQLRAPSNMTLMALPLCPLLPQYKIAKYANQWPDYPGEPWTQRLQKALLANPRIFRNGTVLVYGDTGRQAAHVRPFFTATYTAAELRATRERAAAKHLDPARPVQLAFLGRMVGYKGGRVAIEAVRLLSDAGVAVHLHVAGDGADLPNLRRLAEELQVTGLVTFHGNLNKAAVEEVLLRAHFVLLLSQTEGWPKVVTEGMALGAVPIATGVSCVPWMLDGGTRGTIVDRDPAAVAAAILNYTRAPESYRRAQNAGLEWAARYTLDRFHADVRALARPGAAPAPAGEGAGATAPS